MSPHTLPTVVRKYQVAGIFWQEPWVWGVYRCPIKAQLGTLHILIFSSPSPGWWLPLQNAPLYLVTGFYPEYKCTLLCFCYCFNSAFVFYLSPLPFHGLEQFPPFYLWPPRSHVIFRVSCRHSWVLLCDLLWGTFLIRGGFILFSSTNMTAVFICIPAICLKSSFVSYISPYCLLFFVFVIYSSNVKVQ